jgi:hypothetical protein
MTKINDLNTIDTLSGSNLFVVWNGSTRAISAADAAAYFAAVDGPYQPQDELLTSIAALGPSTSAGDFIEVTAQDTVRVRKLVVATYAALTAIPAAFRFDNMVIYVASYSTDGDGAEGWWRFDAASGATANGGTILAPDAGTGRWIRQDSDPINIRWFGAKGDGVADDTLAIRAAYGAIAPTGSTIFWPAGDYKTSKAIYVKSNTITRFDAGAVVRPVALASFEPLAWWAPFSGVWGYALFINENYQASTRIDKNIEFYNARVIPTTGALVWYKGTSWNGHFIDARGVTNLKIHNCYAEDMADLCGVLFSKDIVVSNCWALRMSNSAYDFWETSENIVVRDNVGIDCNNFSNLNSSDTSDTLVMYSRGYLAEGNTIIGGCGAGAFLISPLNNVSTLSDVIISNNYIDLVNQLQVDYSPVNPALGTTFPNAIVVLNSDNVKITGNTIRRVSDTFYPIYLGPEFTALRISSDCLVLNNVIRDCSLASNSYIGAFGERHIVSNNKAINSTAAAGVIMDDPASISSLNTFGGATSTILNQTTLGVPTGAAFENVAITGNNLFRFNKVVRSTVGFVTSVDYAITATGVDAATAFPIAKEVTFFSTVASGTGAILPSATAAEIGREYVIMNRGANTLIVYAQTGEFINGSASNNLSAGATLRVICVAATLFTSSS